MRERDNYYENERDGKILEASSADGEESGASSLSPLLTLLAWVVGLAGLSVVAVLSFRLGFEMGAANASNGFVDFIYDITAPLVQPFEGIANARSVDGGGVFHPETAFAMGVYVIAAALLMSTLYAWATFFSRQGDEGVLHHHTRMVRGH